MTCHCVLTRERQPWTEAPNPLSPRPPFPIVWRTYLPLWCRTLYTLPRESCGIWSLYGVISGNCLEVESGGVPHIRLHVASIIHGSVIYTGWVDCFSTSTFSRCFKKLVASDVIGLEFPINLHYPLCCNLMTVDVWGRPVWPTTVNWGLWVNKGGEAAL